MCFRFQFSTRLLLSDESADRLSLLTSARRGPASAVLKKVNKQKWNQWTMKNWKMWILVEMWIFRESEFWWEKSDLFHFIFQTLHSYQSTKEHYEFCRKQNGLPYPATFLILISFNNLFLVFNSSINFIIYCAVRKSFRQRIWSILLSPYKICALSKFSFKRSPTSAINHTF